MGDESVESAGELVVALRVGGAPGLVLNRIVFLQVSHSAALYLTPLHSPIQYSELHVLFTGSEGPAHRLVHGQGAGADK